MVKKERIELSSTSLKYEFADTEKVKTEVEEALSPLTSIDSGSDSSYTPCKIKKTKNEIISEKEPIGPVIIIDDERPNTRPSKRNKLDSFFVVKKTKTSTSLPYIKQKISQEHLDLPHQESYHTFNTETIQQFRTSLLQWYDINKRTLPWRKSSTKTENFDNEDKNIHAYQVWVSEIMLQQTQVATVKEFFKRWMLAFPTIQQLASANLEAVNKLWAGLGYYQRAKRLHEGAKFVVDNFNGIIPSERDELLKLPGVGPYTAGAIGSIAFNQPYETVDGNVTRVLTRVLALSGDVRQKPVVDKIWQGAKLLLEPYRAGDFNQAYMDLGSQICTSTSPSCQECPFVNPRFSPSPVCQAYLESQTSHTDLLDLEDLTLTSKAIKDKSSEKSCSICLSIACGDDDTKCFSVTRYPFKSPAKPPRPQILVVKKSSNSKSSFLLIKRPQKGLLAGLWMFPSFELESLVQEPLVGSKKKSTSKATSPTKAENQDLELPLSFHQEGLKLLLNSLKNTFIPASTFLDSTYFCGTVIHKFSHIHQKYHVYTLQLDEHIFDVPTPDPKRLDFMWCSDMATHPLPTAYRKVWETASSKIQK